MLASFLFFSAHLWNKASIDITLFGPFRITNWVDGEHADVGREPGMAPNKEENFKPAEKENYGRDKFGGERRERSKHEGVAQNDQGGLHQVLNVEDISPVGHT